MRSCRYCWAILFLLPFILGMGALGGESPARIPLPEKKFRASFVDQAEMITEARDVSIDGGAFIDGKKGEGRYAIAFENIQYIDFFIKEDKLNSLIKLKDGNTLTLSMNKRAKAYGKTKYGTFQINLVDLKRMTILGPAK